MDAYSLDQVRGLFLRLRTFLGEKFCALEKKLEKVMSRLEDVEAIIGKLNDATTVVANKLTTLSDQIKSGMTPEQVDKVQADLTALSDHLTALGASESNPVPAEVPVLTSAGETPAEPVITQTTASDAAAPAAPVSEGSAQADATATPTQPTGANTPVV